MIIHNILLAVNTLPAGNPVTFGSGYVILKTILFFLTTLSGIVMATALILTGMLMITSHGDPTRFKAGREMLKTTIIGSAVILGATFILQLLNAVFTGGFHLEPIQDIVWYVVTSLGDFIIGLSMVVMITFIVISGIMMTTAGADEERFKKARQMLVNVVWGSMVILGSGVILNTILAIVNRTFFCRIQIIGICLWG